MSGPYTMSDLFGFGTEHDCNDPDCDLEHTELPDGRYHHADCECEDCGLYAYLFLK